MINDSERFFVRAITLSILFAVSVSTAFAQAGPAVDGFDFPVGWPNAVGWNKGSCMQFSCTDEHCANDALEFLEPNDYGGNVGCVLHPGEDWNKPGGDCGEPVHAIAYGKVVALPEDCSWGAMVIRHDNVPGFGTLWSVYGHMDSSAVSLNSWVKRGDLIGLVSDKGPPGTPCHLHLEIRKMYTSACEFPRNEVGGSEPSWVLARYLQPTDFIDANRFRSVATWGRDEFGLGKVPWPNTRFVDVAGGYAHSLGLKLDGSIVAWGAKTDVPSPNTDFVGVSTRDYHSLGLKSNGSIVAWGCGVGDYGQCDVPLPNTGFVAVAAGHSHSVALKDDGAIAAWGANWQGQAELPSPNIGFVGIAAGCWHNVALRSDGSIVSWGCGSPVNLGQCDVPSPNTGFVQIAAGCWHSLALRADGSIVAWGCGGSQDFGQCDVPTSNTRFLHVAGGLAHTLGLKPDGSNLVWGCGDPHSPSYGTCNLASPNAGYVSVASGAYHGIGIKGASTADFDGDGDTDLLDYAALVFHMNGPVPDPSVNRWHSLDVDPDYAVDLRDFAKFQTLLTASP